MRRARQRRIDDLLDVFEAQDELILLPLFQIITQCVIKVHESLGDKFETKH